MTATFSYNYKRAFKTSTEFKTMIDEYFSGSEQRRNQWSTPQRSWVLEFEKNSTDWNAIMDFFEARKGKYEAFNWEWATDKGGDGQTYLVRFDTDKLDIDAYYFQSDCNTDVNSYATFSIPIVEVKS